MNATSLKKILNPHVREIFSQLQNPLSLFLFLHLIINSLYSRSEMLGNAAPSYNLCFAELKMACQISSRPGMPLHDLVVDIDVGNGAVHDLLDAVNGAHDHTVLHRSPRGKHNCSTGPRSCRLEKSCEMSKKKLQSKTIKPNLTPRKAHKLQHLQQSQ